MKIKYIHIFYPNYSILDKVCNIKFTPDLVLTVVVALFFY